ncbi:branched-chain amino acid ABC transporter permease [Leucobacter weissii]|uniref:Branched-chain amino acid ABC transporter permease n=1 Tax=Leucobacter weissii TaxID=1983706 RepID=A0A939MMX1_9MICO|nr:branched-chain amino acid ABC transporter permease [Leucobacter weissii]MBO1902805.1 branched-chain amino acid ABC transporter permease [Leucobacter weissii]
MIESIVAGSVTGSSYAILAVCVVVVYRLVGVLNFGQAALGAFGAYACYAMLGSGIPLPVAVLLGLATAAALAGCAGWVLARWFGEPTTTVRAVVSAVLLVVLLSVGFRLFGDSPRVMPSLVPGVSFELGGVRISLTTVVALAATLLVAGGSTLVSRHTRLGVRLEAMSERPTTVQLLGVNVRLLASGVWAATGAFSALALLLVAPTRNPTFETMSFFVVPALAAGLLGAFSNVWVAAAGGLVIGALEGAGARIDVIADYRGAIPFVVIIAALIWLRRREVWDASR